MNLFVRKRGGRSDVILFAEFLFITQLVWRRSPLSRKEKAQGLSKKHNRRSVMPKIF